MRSGKKKAALAYIKTYIAGHEISPTYREIADAVSLSSTSRIHLLIKALADEGHIKFRRHQQLSIKLTTPEDSLIAKLLGEYDRGLLAPVQVINRLRAHMHKQSIK